MEKTNTTTSNPLSINELVNIIFDTATRTYGIVGICDKDIGKKKVSLLDASKAKKGIFVNGMIEKSFSVSVYVVLSSDVKISETIRECQKAIRYVVNKKTANKCHRVDVYAMAII